jgi:multicomponent Na+:H+ antiporter subunit D
LKAAVFPLFFWLPASYHTAPAPIVAIFAGLLTKVGLYAMIRVYTLIYGGESEWLSPIIGVVAGLTMITGVLGAAAHYDIRRILAFHIVSQIGFMLLGLAIWTPLALAGAILYVIHHIVVKANLFLIAGLIERLGGSYRLQELGGLSRPYPWLALLFLIPALSLAGLPPLSGFWGKLVVIRAGLEAGHVFLAGVALAVGLLTLFSMVKIWNLAFWKAAPVHAPPPHGVSPGNLWLMVTPIASLAAITLAIGFWAEPVVAFSMNAAGALIAPDDYIHAVLGGAR